MLKIASVWKKESRDGRVYFSGHIIGDLWINIFPNKSEHPNAPMYDVFISISKKQEQQSKSRQQQEASKPNPSDVPNEAYEQEGEDDDLPF